MPVLKAEQLPLNSSSNRLHGKWQCAWVRCITAHLLLAICTEVKLFELIGFQVMPKCKKIGVIPVFWLWPSDTVINPPLHAEVLHQVGWLLIPSLFHWLFCVLHSGRIPYYRILKRLLTNVLMNMKLIYTMSLSVQKDNCITVKRQLWDLGRNSRVIWHRWVWADCI